MDAAWLAKVSLSSEEYISVMHKWANNLLLSKESEKMIRALYIFLSLGQIESVLHILLQFNEEYIDIADLFATAAIKNNLINKESPSLVSSLHQIYSSYSAVLSTLEFLPASKYYSSQAQSYIPQTDNLS